MKDWPDLQYTDWSDTCETLHMIAQIVGKVKMTLSTPINHWWHVALYVTPTGLTTGPISSHSQTFQIDLDLCEHLVRISTSESKYASVALAARPVCEFYNEFMAALLQLGIEVKIDTMPKEVPNAIRFTEDRIHASYDKAAVERFRQVLVRADSLFRDFRAKFCGKSSPVQFFWGSFDLSLTRYSGRMYPPQETGGTVTSEEHAVGFWPGSERYPKAAFYSYVLPTPAGYYESVIAPDAARFDSTFGEFILDYDDVLGVADPAIAVQKFLQSTYEAAANLGKWDRNTLELLVLEPVPL